MYSLSVISNEWAFAQSMRDNDYGASGIGTYMTWPAIIDHSGRIMSDFMGGIGSLSCEKDVKGMLQCTAINSVVEPSKHLSRGDYNNQLPAIFPKNILALLVALYYIAICWSLSCPQIFMTSKGTNPVVRAGACSIQSCLRHSHE